MDAVRDALSLTDPEETEGILAATVAKIRKNAVLRGRLIGGYVTAAIEGAELFAAGRRTAGNV